MAGAVAGDQAARLADVAGVVAEGAAVGMGKTASGSAQQGVGRRHIPVFRGTVARQGDI